jgi:hypothetical protein
MKSHIDEYLPGYEKKTKKQNPEYYRKWKEQNKERVKQRMKKYYEDRKAEGTWGIKAKPKPYPSHKKGYYKEKYRRDRREVLSAYGGKCACCGEDHYEFLAIDHIENNGKEHRAELARGTPSGKFGGDTVIRWLRRNNFPPGFQVLCHNCNMAKSLYGECPHKTAENG